jgi:hypothetical protein
MGDGGLPRFRPGGFSGLPRENGCGAESDKDYERRHTPKHGSWPNIAGSEIWGLVRTGLSERIESKDRLNAQLASVVTRRNQSEAKPNRLFANKLVRTKPSSLHPSFKIKQGS